MATVLIIGASRGLGYAMAQEFLARGLDVIGTVRGDARTKLHELEGRIAIEHVDINEPAQLAALRKRLGDHVIDILFVNAGTTTHEEHVRIGDVSTEEFTRVMITNALSPMRAVEVLKDLVPANGLIGVMSSGQGSITNNEKGLREVYRGSKAALNMLMRSFAARESARSLLLLAPGWIRTDLGGPNAPFTVEESTPILVNLILEQQGKAGLRYLDRFGNVVPW